MAIRIEDVAGTDFSDVAGTERIGPVTPGDVLREEFMVPLGLSARALARELGVPSNRITAILVGDRGITAETAILLGERFGTSAEFWLNLQMMHELEEARQHMRGAACVRCIEVERSDHLSRSVRRLHVDGGCRVRSSMRLAKRHAR